MNKNRGYRYTLKVKNCETIFAEGFEPGVLLTQDARFQDVPDPSKDVSFLRALLDDAAQILEENIEVVFEEIGYDECR